ncbi:MAG: sulfide/dihydroorotate dehydrogenase-like FAD/NAD-binding protein [Candidatus Hydrogenedentes bacterium]|nr:sulfide/dihydroorotate dehydrogenase-like FAD/NAD-binding protein [Candidatus Hydrogenedentota bacterium]
MHIKIDGIDVEAKQGETILECALRNGISIPHLCTHPALPPFGACRLCIVEVEGMRGYPTSCTTPVEDGMVIRTNTESLRMLRRNILGLMMLEHPSACLVCERRELCDRYRSRAEKVGSTTGCHTCNNKEVCEVRVLSADLGLAEIISSPKYHYRPVERSEPFIDRDLNLCILCGRCVRICKLHQDKPVIDFLHRGSKTHIGQAFGKNLHEAGCTFCGSCIDVCPTGALSDKYAKWHGAPDKETATTCIYCDEACALLIYAVKGKSISAKSLDENVPICALGRFAIPEFLNSPERLRSPLIRINKVLRPVTREESIARCADLLKDYKGKSFALICDITSTVEDRHVLRKFTNDVMKSPYFFELTPDREGYAKFENIPEEVTAVITTGNFIPQTLRNRFKVVVALDIFHTEWTKSADVVYPIAVFAEVGGTIVDKNNQFRRLVKACNAPGESRQEWEIIQDVAKLLSNGNWKEYSSVSEVTKELGIQDSSLTIGRKEAPDPARNLKLRRTWFRGHKIEEYVLGLTAVRKYEEQETLDVSEPSASIEERRISKEKFSVLSKRELVPNVYEFIIYAPAIAEKAKPGQFVIVMVDESSERIPYTLCEWDEKEGTITLVVQEKGLSSRKMIGVRVGEKLAHIVGPLGTPFEMKNYGTVVLIGGCYGIGAIRRLARELRNLGNRVICISEARSHYLTYYENELRQVSDLLIQTTIDASLGEKGHGIDALKRLIKQGEKVDLVVAIGCPFMMMITAEETRELNLKVVCALNPIMLDGTGMCGACRITVGGEMKFACVDGPFFDAHLVDWDEVRDRREAYSDAEIQAVSASKPVSIGLEHNHYNCSCMMY